MSPPVFLRLRVPRALRAGCWWARGFARARFAWPMLAQGAAGVVCLRVRNMECERRREDL
jgi:hypothetical protein